MSERIERNPVAPLERAVARIYPGSELVDAIPLGADADRVAGSTFKGMGFGASLLLTIREPSGATRQLVFRTARSDVFGHDRRSDRAAGQLLCYDTFGTIPGHVEALDVGAIGRDASELVSLKDAGEFYLLTAYAPGRLYAEDLRKIERTQALTSRDRQRAGELARYLVRLHAEKLDGPARYLRAVRDMVGGGEGIFGIVDSYSERVPAAPRGRLVAIEELAVQWRERLRERTHRLSRIHGDFHPFNLLFSPGGSLGLLDTSRGSVGDPADDVTALSINYLFFAVQNPASWGAFGVLWHRFWDMYVSESGDREVLEVAPPFLAWRGLVVANPLWYPAVEADARDRILGFVEHALCADRFHPRDAEAVFQ